MAYGSQHALRHGERLVVPRATGSPDSLSDAKARQAYRRSWSHRSPPAVSVRPKRGCCRGHDMGAGGPGQRRWPSHHNHHRVFRRDSFVASGYKDDADGIRVHDLANKSWCDGNNHCWTGTRGHSRTLPGSTAATAGTRRTVPGGSTLRRPLPSRLREASAFTKLKPTTELQIVSRPDEDQTGQPNETREAAPPIKTVEKAPADPGATECKKYFPSVGETLPVPCDG